MDRKAHSRPQLETFNRPCGPNGFDVTRIAADEALDPGQNLRLGSQITEARKPSDEPLCLADFNHPLTVAPWLRPRNAGLLAPIKDETSFERSRSAAGCITCSSQPIFAPARWILMLGGDKRAHPTPELEKCAP